MRRPDRGLIVKLSAAGLVIAIGVSLWALGDGAPAGSATVQVRDAAQLKAALAGLRGGERIELAPGAYGRLDFSKHSFSQPVTIAGPADGGRARFDALQIAESRGIRLERVEIGTDQPASDGAYARIQGSQAVVLADCHVHGSLDGDPRNDGLGVLIDKSSDVTVSGCDLEQLQIGVIVRRAERVRVLGNHMHGIRSDGVMSAAAEQLEIASNYITDFTPAEGDHADGIQLQNVNVDRGTTGVVISDNVIMQGAGRGLQGIWISDGATHPHRDVTVTNNLIYISDMYNGIGLSGVDGARVSNNTVVSPASDEMTAWIRVQDATNVRLENNISDRLIARGTVTGLTRKDNLFFVGRATPACLFPRLDAKAQATPADFVVAGVGFQAGPRTHPMLKLAALPAPRANAARRCAGQTEQ